MSEGNSEMKGQGSFSLEVWKSILLFILLVTLIRILMAYQSVGAAQCIRDLEP